MAFYGPYVWRLWLVGGVWGREYDITRNVFENPVPVLRRKISLGFLGDYIGRPLEVGIIRVKGLFLKMGGWPTMALMPPNPLSTLLPARESLSAETYEWAKRFSCDPERVKVWGFTIRVI